MIDILDGIRAKLCFRTLYGTPKDPPNFLSSYSPTMFFLSPRGIFSEDCHVRPLISDAEYQRLTKKMRKFEDEKRYDVAFYGARKTIMKNS